MLSPTVRGWVSGERSANAASLSPRAAATPTPSSKTTSDRCDAGDWVITGTRGEMYPCKPDVFTDTHDPVPGASGRYRKRQVVVEAVRVAEATVVQTLEGPARAERGDWVITGTRGEQWPVKQDVFAEIYEDAHAAG